MQFDVKALDERIQNLIKNERLPGVTVCVKGPEGVVFEKAYGCRDAALSVPTDMDTMFGIASMSKSITCLALSILETEGKLSWDDPVCKYFPAFRVPGAPRDTVTLRTLAQHNAGIPPMEPLEWSIAVNSINRSGEWIDAMRASAPNARSSSTLQIASIRPSAHRGRTCPTATRAMRFCPMWRIWQRRCRWSNSAWTASSAPLA